MAAKREAIYEKYANEYGVDVNELKDRLEAYKLAQEEAIEVPDAETAAKVEKELGTTEKENTIITVKK